MYRHSPIRNPRSKGFKTKNVLQVCLLLAVCFWLIFQVKRSHDKRKEFDNTKKDLVDKTKISLNTNRQSTDETFKLGRKDLQPKLEKDVEIHEEEHEEQDEEHEEQDEEKIDEEKDDGGGGGDDEIDENEQEKSDMEVDREETEVIDEESQTENDVSVNDHEENGASIHTHEGREEHYKADDASSAVVTHLGTENGTLEEISSGETVNNGTSLIDSNENGPPSDTIITTSDSTEARNVTGEQFAPNQTEGSSNSSYVSEVLKSNESNTSDGLKPEVENGESEGELEGESEGEGEGEGEKLEGTEEILDPEEVENETHLEEKEVRMDLDTLPEIETEGGNSEETVVEKR